MTKIGIANNDPNIVIVSFDFPIIPMNTKNLSPLWDKTARSIFSIMMLYLLILTYALRRTIDSTKNWDKMSEKYYDIPQFLKQYWISIYFDDEHFAT